MTTIFRTVTTTLGLAVFAATLTTTAIAGCGDVPGKPAASIRGNLQSYLVQAAYRPAQFRLVSDDDPTGASIVGLWKIAFVSQGNAGIPDGDSDRFRIRPVA